MSAKMTIVMGQLPMAPLNRRAQASPKTAAMRVTSQRRRATERYTGRMLPGMIPFGLVPTLMPPSPTKTNGNCKSEGKKLVKNGEPS